MNKLNPSIKHHTYVGVFISLWIYFFTFYIKPFNGPSFTDSLWWEFLSIGFSLITFISYFISILFQDSIYNQFYKWNIFLETLIIVLFLFLNLLFTYLYYKSPFLNGILTFSEFSNATFKSAIIFTPILLFARRFTLKLLPKEIKKTEEKVLTIKGEYKLDILKILKSDLVCISKSQNYIEIFFLENGVLKSKLIRSSLKKIKKDLFFLIQVHRSHLINPQHFKSWKNQNVILLTQIEIPVSKSYKKNILPL
ncbi:LytTR family DNA-binding domain-containing protein [uncultured Tenacibaculum sp.]|uniref:LytTR family DNA-binding domain-containing protein n=1 Tax=uncultured Tenacibaculum sp. TaxID=174713 RepID=UPI00260C47C4|nr:LytTR family DNA-binding domain-containing protein [uncultured Tenacibaculum sp.]